MLQGNSPFIETTEEKPLRIHENYSGRRFIYSFLLFTLIEYVQFVKADQFILGPFFQGKTQYISGIHDIAVLRKMGIFLSGRVFAALLHISRKIVH